MLSIVCGYRSFYKRNDRSDQENSWHSWHYFEEMFRAIVSTLKSIPDYNGLIDKIHMGH